MSGLVMQRATLAAGIAARTYGLQRQSVPVVYCRRCLATCRFVHCRRFITLTPSSSLLLAQRALASSNGNPTDNKSATPTTSETPTDVKTTTRKSAIETLVKVFPKLKKREKVDLSKTYTDNIYVTPLRAMNEYLVSASDLKGLLSSKRRSPYPERDDITVYLRKDVEKKSVAKWGSLENMKKQRSKILNQEKAYNIHVFNQRKAIREYEKQHQLSEEEKPFVFDAKTESMRKRSGDSITKSGAGRVVLWAIAINGMNTLLKAVAWLYTGSHSMFAETVHSLADTLNQMILAAGIQQSLKQADTEHPYGWSNVRNVASLISGVGIFCIGSGLSIYHGIEGLIHPDPVTSLHWALLALGGSFVSEGASCLVAIREVVKNAKLQEMGLLQYVWQGADPSTNVVLLEDLAAIVGIGIAATCMGVSYYTGNPMADAVGSLMIGGLLGGVASFIIYSNTNLLVGKSIPSNKKLDLIQELENDRVIRALHDVKATDMGSSSIKFKAEVDFDGKEITRLYLEGQDLEKMLAEMKQYDTIEDVEAFMLKHGESIVDTLGSEVDRIEKQFKKKHPEIRHIDLEQL